MKKITTLLLSVAIWLMLLGMPAIGLAQNTDVDFQRALNQLREARQDFKEAKAHEANEQARVSQEQNQVRRRQAEQRQVEAQKRRENHRETVLLRLIDIQVKHLNRTKERVGRMPGVEASLKAELNVEIDKNVQKLGLAKTKVQNASTAEELKDLAKEIRDLVRSYHEVIKRIVEAIHVSHLANIIVRAEDRVAAIKVKINELKSDRKDTVRLEADLIEAEGKIGSAKNKADHRAFLEASEDLKGAYQKFRDIADKAKGL